ncbi:Macrolide-specific efflux protein MacA, partial [hydrothermal vent metagenome]
FNVDAYPNDSFTGTVEQVRLASQEIQNVVTYTVVVSAQNLGGKLLPGMTANVEITTDKRKDVLRIAELASRFRPPEGGPKVVNAEEKQTRGNAAHGGGRGAFGGQMLAGLNLPPERSKEIENLIAAEIKTVREGAGNMAQFRRAQMREIITARIDRVLKKKLTEEEYKTFQKAQKSRATVRRILLHKENPDGTLSTQSVRVGLSDGSNIEILGGAVEGDVFITRLLKVGGANK